MSKEGSKRGKDVKERVYGRAGCEGICQEGGLVKGDGGKRGGYGGRAGQGRRPGTLSLMDHQLSREKK